MGRDKALLRLPNGQPLIAHLYATLAAVCDDVVLVGGDPARFGGLRIQIPWAPDAAGGEGPLAGILGAFAVVRHDACVVVACDMPFVTAQVVAVMAEELGDCDALAYPRGDSFEPLLAIYRRSCVPTLRALLGERDYRARALFLHVQGRALSLRAVASVDPNGLAAVNLNTPQDLERAMHHRAFQLPSETAC